jgi:hypothetical protein
MLELHDLFPMNSKVRLGIFFIFLILIAVQVWLVLHIEYKIATYEGFYSKRNHPKRNNKD